MEYLVKIVKIDITQRYEDILSIAYSQETVKFIENELKMKNIFIKKADIKTEPLEDKSIEPTNSEEFMRLLSLDRKSSECLSSLK